MAADVVGYSRLMGEDEAETLAALRNLRREVFAPTVSEHNGTLVKSMGDGWLVEFSSVADGVSCAIEIQEALADHGSISLRIGLHVGDVTFEEEDIYGDGVNVASRLQELAEPGAIVISGAARSGIDGKLSNGFSDLGSHELKNIATPVTAFGWGMKDIASEVSAMPLPDKPSIVVLPFNNMSGDPDQEYFSDGLSEDLTTALSRFDSLFVIARNSAFSYKGKAIDVKSVGRELGVRYLLEGSVRRSGERVRINAQLIDADADRHVWAERFDRRIDDIFELQDDIVASIAATVGPEITSAEMERVRNKRPEALRTWDLYLRAMAGYHTMTKESVAEAVLLLERAIETEPDFGVAYALLGLCRAHVAIHGWVQPVRGEFEEALRLTEKAARLAPSSPEANYSLAFSLSLVGKADKAVTAARRAIDLNPNHAEAYAVLALALVFAGDPEGCLDACKKSARSSPRDFRGNHLYNAMAHGYFMLGDYENAVDAATKGNHLDPTNYGQMLTLAAANAYLGNAEDAKHYVDMLLRHVPRINLRNLQKNPMFIRTNDIERLVVGMRLAGLPE
jgi:adenylate cyclase